MSTSRKSVLDGILYFVNIVFALGLLLSYLAYYIPPSAITIFSFAALAYPVWIVVNILFIFYWMIRFKAKILLPIICIGIGYMHLPRLYQPGSPEKVVKTEDRLKVMSFNVRMFNQYKWLKQDDIPEKILAMIEKEDPDVLLLQEYRDNWKKAPNTLGFPYRKEKLTDWGRFGSVIYSKFPISTSGILPFEGDTAGNHQFQYADINWKGRKIRFINVHLASVGLEEADYKLLENPEKEPQDQLSEGLRSIVRSLNRAFIRRDLQIESVKKVIEESPYPIVLTGDFNDVPQSYAYHRINLDLKDSFVESGQGFGKTYVKSPLPLRIDFIFHSKELHAFNFKVIDRELSDHYPVVTSLEWR